jgi:transcriptional regulator with XRE-family HTH domain
MTEIYANHSRALGKKLQTARKQQHISLRQLAGKADISASMLSQIETGKANPSVRSLYNIAGALNVPVDYFFPDADNNHSGPPASVSSVQETLTASEMRAAQTNLTPGESSPVSARPAQKTSAVIHAAARPTIELRGGVTWSRLTAMVEAGAEFLEVTYAPGAMSGSSMSHHEGREFGLILEGELVVELGFDSHTLQAHDSIIFDSTTPHRLINKSPYPTRAVWVVFAKQN